MISFTHGWQSTEEAIGSYDLLMIILKIQKEVLRFSVNRETKASSAWEKPINTKQQADLQTSYPGLGSTLILDANNFLPITSNRQSFSTHAKNQQQEKVGGISK